MNRFLIILVLFYAGGLIPVLSQTNSSSNDPQMIISRTSIVSTEDKMTDFWSHMSEIQTFSAFYQEEKHVRFLAEPFRSQGWLFYKKPGELIRKEEQPALETTWHTNAELTVTYHETNHIDRLDLARQPDIQPVVNFLLWILDNQQTKIASHFILSETSGNNPMHVVTLTPKSESLSQVIDCITVKFNSDYLLEELRIKEPSGDYSLMLLSQGRINKPLADIPAFNTQLSHH